MCAHLTAVGKDLTFMAKSRSQVSGVRKKWVAVQVLFEGERLSRWHGNPYQRQLEGDFDLMKVTTFEQGLPTAKLKRFAGATTSPGISRPFFMYL